MTTIALPYSTKITRDSDMELATREISAQFGDGYRQAAPDGLNAVYEEWNITWAPLTKTERNSLLASLQSIGTWGIATWTPCDETVQKKFNIVGKVSFGRVNKSLYKVQAQLKQVFDV